jgi:hypothetical protein
MIKERESEVATMLCSKIGHNEPGDYCHLLFPRVLWSLSLPRPPLQLNPLRPPLLTRGLGYSLATGKPIT